MTKITRAFGFWQLSVSAFGLAVLLSQLLNTTQGVAAGAKEVSKDIIAVQIRKQGFACKTPESAEHDADASKPDGEVWILKCDDASYRVHLIPNMAAAVEKLADREKTPNP